jgi:hypothetical protein
MPQPAVFTFQANSDGSVTFSSDTPSTKEKVKLAKGQQVRMQMLPATPSDRIESATISFEKKLDQEGWPFVGQDQANLAWNPNSGMFEAVSTYGKWCFGATLTSKGGTVYTLPDPELEVGDGPG